MSGTQLPVSKILDRQREVKRLIDAPESPQISVVRYNIPTSSNHNTTTATNNRYLSQSKSGNSPSSSTSDHKNNNRLSSVNNSSLYRHNSISDQIHDTNNSNDIVTDNDHNKTHPRARKTQSSHTQSIHTSVNNSTIIQSPASNSISSISHSDDSSSNIKQNELSFNRIDVPAVNDITSHKSSPLAQQIERWTPQTVNVINHRTGNTRQYNQLNDNQNNNAVYQNGTNNNASTIRITVYMPHIDSELIQLECNTNTTSQQLINDALQQYKRDNAKYAQHNELQYPAQNYKLYICEEDGM